MITKEKIYEIEHKILQDQDLWIQSDSLNGLTLHYILGMNELAQAICDAIERDEST